MDRFFYSALLATTAAIAPLAGAAAAAQAGPASVDPASQPLGAKTPAEPAKDDAAALQADDAPSVASDAASDIVVTGSRVARAGYNAPTPTTVLGTETLVTRAPATLADGLALLPAFRNSSTPSTASTVVAGNGGAGLLNLRSLGPGRTLILLDRQRIVPTTNTGLVDTSLLPSALISRVDVVTGGASAAYGSDAVAGVVNFVLDSRYKGAKFNLETGISSHGDDDQQKISATWGGDLSDRLHLIATAEYFRSAGLGARSRDFAAYSVNLVNNPSAASGQKPLLLAPYVYSNNATWGGVIVGGPLANTQFLPGGATSTFVPCAPSSAGQICSGPRDDIAWINYFAFLAVPQKRGSAFARLSYDVSPSISISADGLYGRSFTRFQTIPSNTQVQGLITIRRDNAFLPGSVAARMDAAGISTFQLGRFFREDRGARPTRDAEIKRGSLGLKADLGSGWKMDAYAGYGESGIVAKIGNMPIRANYNRALDSVLVGGAPTCRINADADPTNNDAACSPTNPFGEANTNAARAYTLGESVANTRTTQFASSASISGEPFSTWAGPVSIVGGLEYRSETARTTVDPISAAAGFSFINPTALKGSIKVKEVFGETVIPLAKDVTLLKNLEVNAAGRITNYSTSGTVKTWKLGLNYTPFNGIRLRGTISQDIRAPSIFELNTPLTQTNAVFSVIDPQNQQSVTIVLFNGGNTQLTPEVSKTKSAGIVFQPTGLPGFSASVDYYSINVGKAITTITPQAILTACQAGDAGLCGLVYRNGVAGARNGNLTRIDAGYVNAQSFNTDGVDIEASYRTRLDAMSTSLPGTLSLRALANYTGKFITKTPTTNVDSAGQYDVPHWTADFSVLYTVGKTTVLLNPQYRGGGFYQATLKGQIENEHVKRVWYLNATVEQGFKLAGVDVSAYLNANNILNQKPPFPTNFTGGNYDRIGPYFRLGLRVGL